MTRIALVVSDVDGTLVTKDKTLTVHWNLNTPRPGSFVTQTLTHPAQAVLVDRFNGEVTFDPPAKK